MKQLQFPNFPCEAVQIKYFNMEITDQSAEIKSVRSVPYLGIRGVGFNLSYSF